VLAGSLKPTDGAARGAHPHGDLLLGETGPLACLEELPEKAEFHGGLLPRCAVARHLIEPGTFGTAFAEDRLIGRADSMSVYRAVARAVNMR
jgi:hypothetical protein